MESYLKDKDFLTEICSQKTRNIFAKVTALTKDEIPLEEITGRVISGNINIDGTSAVRRTCTIGLTAKWTDEKQINNEFFTSKYWGLNTKFTLEIGIENLSNNETYKNYKIIWFPQGTYLIANFSPTYSATGITFNISGKDKMCQLNGDIGGVLSAQTDFGTIEDYDLSGVKTITKIPIYQIIRELIHTYANESYGKIIIEDIPKYGFNLETYRGNIPMYFFLAAAVQNSTEQNVSTPIEPINYTFNSDFKVKYNNKIYKLEDIPDDLLYKEGLESISSINNTFTIVAAQDDKEYYIRKITYGETVGYKLTNLVYPGDLIANAGETIVSVLDKIKKMLGDFEYFYDLDGTFVFRKQKAYKTSNTKLNITSENDISIIKDYDLNIDFTFNNLELITSLSNNSNINNVKNDYTIWGASGDNSVPIHLRYAIDKRPTTYTTIDLTSKIDLNDNQSVDRATYLIDNYSNLFAIKQGESREDAIQRLKNKHPLVTYEADDTTYDDENTGIKHRDWRELIYQMAKDYRNFNQVDEFEYWLSLNNSWVQNGKTGYEQYYIDLEGFWRNLYQPDDLVFNWYDKYQTNIEYNVTYHGNTATVTYNPLLTNQTITINNKNMAIDSLELFIGIVDEETEEMTYQSIGILKNILKTNYNILQRQIERLIIIYLKSHNLELYNLLQDLYPDAISQDILYFKDPNTVVLDTDNKTFISPKDSKQLYHGFQKIYMKKVLNDAKTSYVARPCYMSTTTDINDENIFPLDKINGEFNNDEFKQVTKKYDMVPNGALGNWYNYFIISDNTNHDLDILNKELIYSLCDDHENYFEWFTSSPDRTAYYSLGKYYPLTSMNNLYVDVDGEKYQIIHNGSIQGKQINLFNNLSLNFSSIISFNRLIENKNINIVDNNQLLYALRLLLSHPDYNITYRKQGFDNNTSWSYDVLGNPEKLLFWFDILETKGQLNKYSIPIIGWRPKVTNDSAVKAVKYRDTLNNIFIDSTDEITNTDEKINAYFQSNEFNPSYNYYNLGTNFSNFLSLSGQGKDAFSVLENELYNNAHATNTITLGCIPLFFLEPNKRIQLYNTETNINGTYILQKISFQLSHNGNMTLNAQSTIDNNINRSEVSING